MVPACAAHAATHSTVPCRRYPSSLLRTAKFNDSGKSLPSSELKTSDDPILTALAQLGTCQTGTDRALISLFDADHQYIVAEATPSISLRPSLPSDDCCQPLWLCGTAIPRSHGVRIPFLATASAHEVAENENENENHDPTHLPLTLSQDLIANTRLSSKLNCQPGSAAGFYAGKPFHSSKSRVALIRYSTGRLCRPTGMMHPSPSKSIQSPSLAIPLDRSAEMTLLVVVIPPHMLEMDRHTFCISIVNTRLDALLFSIARLKSEAQVAKSPCRPDQRPRTALRRILHTKLTFQNEMHAPRSPRRLRNQHSPRRHRRRSNRNPKSAFPE
ncbi:hypothetical protein AUP68_05440 [Ilyonectria robusta]